jgi:Tol biopolymer transport system component
MTAEPVMVLDGVASGQFGGPLLDVSHRGDLLYLPGREPGNRLVWVTRSGERSDAGAPRAPYVPAPRLSPDGRRVAVSSGTADHFLWLYSLDTGTLTALTDRDTHQAVWSPDNRMVAVPLPMGGIAVKNVETTADSEVVLEEGGAGASTWSPDGSMIVGNRPSRERGYELFALRLSDRTARTLLRSQQPLLDAQFSPDGHWLAYATNESGRLEVYVTDFPAARVKKPVSTDGGAGPRWARDGKELFYVRGTTMMSARVRSSSSIEFDRPVQLFDGIDGVGNVNTFSVAPDGRFLFVEERDSSAPRRDQLTLVLNWFEELRRRVPVR